MFVMGIPELTLPVIQAPPVDQWVEYRKSPEDENLELAYFTFPQNSLVVIDEAQRVYRPRPVGSKVPGEVAAFETHRHLGIDFILITQHAGLIDSNIRKLIGRHIHIRVTALARYRYEWTELGDPESSSSRELAAREKYVLPKRAFGLYKSSELHTKIRKKIPFFVWVFAFASVLAVGLGAWAFHRVTLRTSPEAVSQSPANTSGGVITSAPGAPVSQVDLLVERTPRIHGEPHTAPRYDALTVAIAAPELRGCIESDRRCRCQDQDGNDYPVSQSRCRSLAVNGFAFQDWGSLPLERKAQREQRARVESVPAQPGAVPPASVAPLPQPPPASSPTG